VSVSRFLNEVRNSTEKSLKVGLGNSRYDWNWQPITETSYQVSKFAPDMLLVQSVLL